MTALGFDRFAAELRAEADAFASTVDGADLALRVPTCPEWTLEQLVHHVGRAYYWATAIITSATMTFIPFESVPEAVLPEQPGKHGDWLRNGAEQLVSAVAETGAESTVWTWAQDRRAGFWLRRLTHETVVHRADAAFTVARPYELAADLAADGVSESLELLASRMMVMPSPALASLAGTGQTLHFHATDDGLGDAGEWLIRCTPDGPAPGTDRTNRRRQRQDRSARRRSPVRALAGERQVLNRSPLGGLALTPGACWSQQRSRAPAMGYRWPATAVNDTVGKRAFSAAIRFPM